METGNKNFNTLLDNKRDESIIFKLSARIKADSFFYAIYDTSNKLLVTEEIGVTTLLEIQDNHILKQNFASIVIALDDKSYSLIDKDEFEDSENNRIFFDHLVTNVHKGLYHNDMISSLDIVNVYPLNNSDLDIVLEIFPSARIIHFSTSLINFALKYKSTAVYAHVEGGWMTITYVSNKLLMFCKQFEISSEQDFLYFITLIYQEFEIDQNNIPLILSGSIYPESKMFNLVKEYIKNIEFPIMNKISLAQKNEDVIKSHYFDQYAICECE